MSPDGLTTITNLGFTNRWTRCPLGHMVQMCECTLGPNALWVQMLKYYEVQMSKDHLVAMVMTMKQGNS